MSYIRMTREAAYAIGRDAGNANMRKANRTKWNDDDWNASVEAFERHWNIERELEQRRMEAAGDPCSMVVFT